MAIEHADCATVLGNQSTIRTYEYALKPIFRVPLSTCAVYPWPGEKDFDSCRKNFLWFGSNGFVHKGLDLVLDVFAEMPDYHLYVCGPIQQEKDFENAYYKELYQSQNIHTVGWVDIESPAFIEVANQCTGIIYPSCAEGQAGSVVTCMHTGLIPIISYESGVDVSSNFGLILEDCSIETIKRSIESISSLPGEQIRQMSRRAWEFARANHTREKFAEEYKKIILNIISKHSKKGNLLDQNLIQRDAFA
jgi:glycosyltransferase involved in cell wall biosynthesis